MRWKKTRGNLRIHNPDRVPALERLATDMTIVPDITTRLSLPDDVTLANKDMPILPAAVKARCTHLLTGDKRHFEALYGRNIQGVRG